MQNLGEDLFLILFFVRHFDGRSECGVSQGCGVVSAMPDAGWGCARIRELGRKRQQRVQAATRREVMIYLRPSPCLLRAS